MRYSFLKRVLTLLAAVTLVAAVSSCVTKPKGKPVATLTAPSEDGNDSWFITLHPEVSPGVQPFTLGGPLFGHGRIKGYATVEAAGGWKLSVDTYHYFETWGYGWTEADFLVLGDLMLTPVPDGWKLTVIEVPEIESVRGGSIRYKDKILHGDESAKMIINRWYRIEAAAEYLHGKLPAGWYDWFDRKPKKGESFIRSARTLLFPEVFGYPAGTAASEKLPENRVRGELLTWDTAWSREQFPEHLREVRDAGTLYRDYEEMAPLMYTLYQWNLFWKEKAATLVFIKEN